MGKGRDILKFVNFQKVRTKSDVRNFGKINMWRSVAIAEWRFKNEICTFPLENQDCWSFVLKRRKKN